MQIDMRNLLLLLCILPGSLLFSQPGITFHYDGGETDSLPRFERIDIHETYPLSRGVYFDHGDLSLPDRYVTGGEARYRDGGSPLLVAGGTLRKNSYLPDIIGWRMVRYPEERLTLRPGFSAEPGEDREIARRRGEGVAAWLVREWGINPDRIEILDPVQIDCRGDDSSCREDARFVEIESSGPHLTAPIEINETRYFGLPTDITFSFVDSAGPRLRRVWVEWYRGGELLFRRDLERMAKGWEGGIGWDDTLMIPGSGTPPGNAVVEVHLYGEPEGEERAELRSYRYDFAMISILSSRDNPRIIDCFGTGRRARYSTPLFARDSSGADLPMLLFLQRIAESRDSILSVTITGYVSLGEEAGVGEERATRVAEILRTLRPDLAPVIEISPTRPESIMYRQETPEGRMHNRTVQLLLRLPEFSPPY